MAVLTLTPSRFAPANSFPIGSTGFVFTDRHVTRLGQVVLSNPDVVQTTDGTISFDLTPNELIDEQKTFMYIVVVTQPDGSVLYSHSIEMPNAAANLFDLVPIEQDLNALTPTTLPDNS